MPQDQTSPPVTEIERVERASAVLSPLEREVLVLSAGHGLSTWAIAERLGIGERRARRLLARALSKFDRALTRTSSSRWRLW
jgi:RNA polymerase sigma factor (sigma-70 family)